MAPGTRMPPQFMGYWLHGEGAGIINWGSAGDFARCETAIQEKVTQHGGKPLADHVIKGLCATLHRMATGATPGHAAGESIGHGHSSR